MNSLTVSIINYRTGPLTLQCVRTVLDDLAATAAIDGHVVVVDNASGDGSAEEIAAWIDAQDPPVPVTLVRSTTNSGFSGGHNRGIAGRPADLAPAEWVLVLNSDAVVTAGFFDHLLRAAAERPQIGLFAPRIEYEAGGTQVNCFRFPSPISELLRGAASGPITRLLSRYAVPLNMPPDEKDIDWASFACILIRSTVIEAVGPMDEGYFLYFEDAEYCLRARRAGWRIAYVPEAVAVHFRGGSGPVKALAAQKKRMPHYYYASRARFLRQAHGVFGPVLGNLCWGVGRLLAQTRRLAGKDVPRAVAQEGRDIWINVTRPLTGPDGGPER